MATIPLLWAVEAAPVADAQEAAILSVMASKADTDGCATFRSRKTIAYRLQIDEQTVKRRQAAMERRGLIRRGDQNAASYIPENRRPLVYDLCVPHSWLAENKMLDQVNEARAAKGLPGVTPADRPDLAPPPAKRPRRNTRCGVKRVALSLVDNSPVDNRGVCQTPHPQSPEPVDNPPETAPPGVCGTPSGGSDRPPTLKAFKDQNLTTERPVDNFPGLPTTAHQQQEESDDEIGQNTAAVAADVLYDLPDWIARRVDRNTRERLIPVVERLLRGGWLPADLLEQWTSGMDPRRTKSPAGLLVAKLRNLPLSPPRGLGLIGESFSSWCMNAAGGGCRPSWRWVDGPDGLPTPCPDCNSEQLAAIVARRAG
jgi:hypothetical protein